MRPGLTTTKARPTSPQRSIGDADHRCLGNVGMVQQHHLDLGRKDVLAARNEHVLAAVDEGDEAVAVLPPDVAGAEPAVVGEGAAPSPPAGSSSRRDVGTGQPELAGLSLDDVMPIIVDDAQRQRRRRPAPPNRPCRKSPRHRSACRARCRPPSSHSRRPCGRPAAATSVCRPPDLARRR